VTWNLVPFLPEPMTSRKIECPVAELRLPGGAVYLQPFDLHHVVLEVDHRIPKHRLRQAPVLLKEPVMVSSDEDLARIGKLLEPVREGSNLVKLPFEGCVPGVDHHVGLRHPDLVPQMHQVRVGHQRNLHSSLSILLIFGGASKSRTCPPVTAPCFQQGGPATCPMAP